MSFSITPSDTIRKHATNTSASKEIHMFAKTPRFSSPNPECPTAFYSYDSQLSHRKTSFGYGNKSDFTKCQNVSPPVTKYTPKNFLDLSKNHGKSFGTARERLPDNSYLVPQLQKIPGPGLYENDKKRTRNYSYTARSKPVDMVEANLTYKKSPGPGTHSEIDLEPSNGRFKVSKYSDSKYGTINPNSVRFIPIKQSPGPSTYLEGDSINGEGKYVLSNRKSNGRRLFSKTARGGSWKGFTTPGPGSYDETSEFGHYPSSQYYKTIK